MTYEKVSLLLCTVIALTNQVSSLKCYFCHSDIGGISKATHEEKDSLCVSYPKQKDFEYECSWPCYIEALWTIHSNVVKGNTSIFPEPSLLDLDELGNHASSAMPFGFDCFTLIGDLGSIRIYWRGCVAKRFPTEKFGKPPAYIENVKVVRCDTDFCNTFIPSATTSISIGIWTFIISLISSFYNY